MTATSSLVGGSTEKGSAEGKGSGPEKLNFFGLRCTSVFESLPRLYDKAQHINRQLTTEPANLVHRDVQV